MNILESIMKRKRQSGTMTIEAVITRADGTVEDLGVIAKGPIVIVPESR